MCSLGGCASSLLSDRCVRLWMPFNRSAQGLRAQQKLCSMLAAHPAWCEAAIHGPLALLLHGYDACSVVGYLIGMSPHRNCVYMCVSVISHLLNTMLQPASTLRFSASRQTRTPLCPGNRLPLPLLLPLPAVAAAAAPGCTRLTRLVMRNLHMNEKHMLVCAGSPAEHYAAAGQHTAFLSLQTDTHIIVRRQPTAIAVATPCCCCTRLHTLDPSWTWQRLLRLLLLLLWLLLWLVGRILLCR